MAAPAAGGRQGKNAVASGTLVGSLQAAVAAKDAMNPIDLAHAEKENKKSV